MFSVDGGTASGQHHRPANRPFDRGTQASRSPARATPLSTTTRPQLPVPIDPAHLTLLMFDVGFSTRVRLSIYQPYCGQHRWYAG